MSVWPVFALLSRTPPILWQKHTSEHLFYRAAPSGCFQMSVILLKKGKTETNFHTFSTLIRLKSCNCIKIKTFSFMILRKLLESIIQFFQYKVRKTTLYLLLTFMFTFFFKFLQTSLIRKELIKHGNKFNRKVFHNRKNSENRFSEFSYFMKGLKKYIMNISR